MTITINGEARMSWRDELIRESEWERVYKSHRWGRVHESKFLIDGMQVSAEDIIRRWPDLSSAERLEFAKAFADKSKVTPEDERILDFLMETGDCRIWRTIALVLLDHRDRERVLAFLLKRIREERKGRANFFQALELMKDKRAVLVLRAAYDDHRKKPQGLTQSVEEFDYVDYLQCCKALWALDSSTEYREAIEECSKSPVKSIRSYAARLLSGG